jgi:hypothetical protein
MRSRVMRSVSQAPTPSVTLHTINKIHKKHTQTNKQIKHVTHTLSWFIPFVITLKVLN